MIDRSSQLWKEVEPKTTDSEEAVRPLSLLSSLSRWKIVSQKILHIDSPSSYRIGSVLCLTLMSTAIGATHTLPKCNEYASAGLKIWRAKYALNFDEAFRYISTNSNASLEK